MPETAAADAPAKINLVLEVLERRPDGYHELRTVMQKLTFADRVTVSWDADPGVTVSGPAAPGTPADETNLAWQAATALQARIGRKAPMPHIALDKRIPAASGLGGGASDASTVLRLLAVAWNVDDETALLDAANAVGSDEAFFLGGTTALVTGRGDVVEPLPALAPHGVVLFVPEETLPRKTATLFQALARQPFDEGARTAAFLERHPAGVTVAGTFNAFERVAFDAFPGLRSLRDAIEGAIEAPVRLAGAGPSLFWIGPRDLAAAIAARAADIRGLTVVATATEP